MSQTSHYHTTYNLYKVNALNYNLKAKQIKFTESL